MPNKLRNHIRSTRPRQHPSRSQGPGTTQFSGGTIADATTDQLLLTLDIETLDADCNTGTPSLIYTNQSGGTAIVIRESRGDELTLIGRLTVATLAA